MQQACDLQANLRMIAYVRACVNECILRMIAYERACVNECIFAFTLRVVSCLHATSASSECSIIRQRFHSINDHPASRQRGRLLQNQLR